jgi:hypothetical protein
VPSEITLIVLETVARWLHILDCVISNNAHDVWQECGVYPKAIEQGHKHPYCSQTCAQNSKLRLRPNAKKPVRSDLCTVSKLNPSTSLIPHLRRQGCGKNPRLRGSTYCSETCARKSTVRSPMVCLLLGCAAASSPAFGGLCSVAHLKYAQSSRLIIYIGPRRWFPLFTTANFGIAFMASLHETTLVRLSLILVVFKAVSHRFQNSLRDSDYDLGFYSIISIILTMDLLTSPITLLYMKAKHIQLANICSSPLRYVWSLLHIVGYPF